MKAFTGIALCALFTACGQAGVLIETAGDGGYGKVNGGTSISQNQYVGFAFHLDTQTHIDWIGGHFYSPSDDTSIFMAIANLESIDALPAGEPFQPFNPGVLVGSATFDDIVKSRPSGMYYEPLSLTLDPGDYAIIAGSGRGVTSATGSAAMPSSEIINTDAMTWHILGWEDGGSPSLRMVIGNGEILSSVPEPASTAITGLLLVWFAVHLNARRLRSQPQS